MALSDIAICNMALGHVGRTAASIQSFTERSTEARLCALWYDQCRREVLEALDWPFARARAAIALHGDTPPIEWAYRYQTPSDMLAVRRVWNPFKSGGTLFGNSALFVGMGDLTNEVPYELETSLNGEALTLLTNLDSASLIYTRDATLVQMFTPLFVNALSHYIAAKIAVGITGKPGFADIETKAAQAAMRSAAASVANQGMPGPIRDASRETATS